MRVLRRLAAAVFFAAIIAAPALADDLGWARENARRGRYADAVKLYRKALESGALEVKVELAKVLMTTGEYKEALELATRAAKDHPKESAAHTALGEASMEVGLYKEAASAFDEAVRLDGKNMPARWGQVQALRTTGERRRAHELAGWFFDYYAENDVTDSRALMYVALAAKDEDPKEAFRLLGQAMKEDAANEDAFIARGYLAVERYSFGSAAGAFGQILAKNPRQPMAHLGQAHVQLAAGKNDKAQKACEEALKINPNLVAALNMMATLSLIDEDFDGTPEQLERSIRVNPNNLETLSMQAAFAHLNGDAKRRDELISKVHSINPMYHEVYVAVARASERKRNMPDAVEWGRKAIDMAPKDWQGHYVVGMNLLRMGREREGYRVLGTAHDLNKFNVWARNTLVCLDKDFRKHEFESFTTDHFVVKLHKTESQILGPYITKVLEELHAELTKKYRFEPKGTQEGGRILVSFFPEHADFSARTVGLPGLSALGACMGQLVTMPSPKVGVERGPGGMFNWERVLEHEFTHVITLQLTRYKIPRWFTEGISVWEEADPQLKWDMLFKSALERGQLLPLEKINRGFTRPSYPTQVPASYYHASLIVKHFVETYGMDGVLRMCRLYREGKKTPEVMETVTGKPLERVNKEVMDYVRAFAAREIMTPVPMPADQIAKLVTRVGRDEKDAKSRSALAAAYLAGGRAKDAKKLALEAVKIDPAQARAHNVLGYIALRVDKKKDLAEQHFRAAAEADESDYYSRFAVGYIMTQTGRIAEALPYLERSLEIYPRNTTARNMARQSPYHLLGGLYEDRKETAKAISIYRKAFEIDHTDYRSAKQLGMLLLDAGEAKGAVEAFERCFEINPFEAKIHSYAGEASARCGMHAVAAREFRIAFHLDPRSFDAAMGLARALERDGRKKAALDAAKKALEIEPDSDAAKALIESLK